MITQKAIIFTVTTAAAVAVTGLAVELAIAGASSRAANAHAVNLVGYMSVAVILAVHLAPALLRSVPRAVLWPTWALCLAGALYAHASFLAAASRDAAAAQLASSPAAAAAAQQRADIERSLDNIKARPTAQISRQLSWATDPVRAAALQVELQEARRADVLRDRLIALSVDTAAAAASATSDPLGSAVAGILGVSSDAVTLTISLLLAFLIELIGMLLWREVFTGVSKPNQAPESAMIPAPTAAPKAEAVVQPVMQQVVQFNMQPPVQPVVHEVMQADDSQRLQIESDDKSRLRAAIERGECGTTVADVRTFFRCSQDKARALRRAVVTP